MVSDFLCGSVYSVMSMHILRVSLVQDYGLWHGKSFPVMKLLILKSHDNLHVKWKLINTRCYCLPSVHFDRS